MQTSISHPLLYEVALSLIPGIGSKHALVLINHFGNAKKAIEATPKKIKEINGIGEKIALAIKHQCDLKHAQWVCEESDKQNIKILFYQDPKYPQRLLNTNDFPIILYYKGKANLNMAQSISIVGTRRATVYGKNFTEKLLEDIKTHLPGAVTVSGLAFGIDICAHKASLQQQIPTIGVVAHGLDTIYPTAHHEIAKQMIASGGLLSEHPVGVTAEMCFFPKRNRIIAALGDAIVVIEAAKKGGALITALVANDYNKDVFALPGNIQNTYSAGCNNLIKKHQAHLFTGIEDILFIMNWEKGNTKKITPPRNLTIEEGMIINILKNEITHIDELSLKTSLNPSKLSAILLALELENIITPLPGKKYSIK